MMAETRRNDVGGDSPPRHPLIIGLTGTIASGKSTVARMLHGRGGEVIDADDVYRSLLGRGSPLSTRIASRFGPSVIAPDGDIDRPALADIVFHDTQALTDLDNITHPAVVMEIRRRLATSDAPVIAIEAVKLAHTDLLGDIDSLWLIEADSRIRVDRLIERSGLDANSARQRIAAFNDPIPRGVLPDIVINTSGDLKATERQVDAAWVATTRANSDRVRSGLATGKREER